MFRKSEIRNPKFEIPKKVVSFDLDGTIVDAAYGNMVWLEGIPEKYARRHSIPLEHAKQTVRREYDAIGEANILWYDITYWLRRFDVALSIPELLDEYRDHIRLLPHVAEVIRLLSEKYRLVIASNAARIFVEKELSHTGLGRYFDRIISATSDFRMVKKEEQFYWKLCSVMGVSPSEIVHVGDHSVFDVEVPLRVGIDSYHYDPSRNGKGEAVRDFRELLDLL